MLPEQVMEVADFASRNVPFRLRDDARQEAALAVLKAIPRFRSKRNANLKTFVSARAKGAIQDFWRRNDTISRRHRIAVKEGKCQPVSTVSVLYAKDLKDPGVPPDRAVMERELFDAVGRCLTPKQAQVIRALFLYDQTFSEVAEDLGINLASLFYIRREALKILRKKMEDGNL